MNEDIVPIKPVHDSPTHTHKPSGVKEFIKFAVIVVVVVLGVRTYIAQPFVVSGASMVPTFTDANYLIIDELTYRFEEPKRGDVIVFHPPKDPRNYYIKRIIGIPGDTVSISKGVVTIINEEYKDGLVLNEPYINKANPNDVYNVKVTEDNYFVMGDNRPASYDSRGWGLLPKKNITGRAFLRLFPLNKIDLFPGEHPNY
ncbi:MAG: signal peptidase I [Candidatus Pacebacteria bacterium]|nr:signal peptidase I [Candidatus Paceibacterota bacterium]